MIGGRRKRALPYTVCPSTRLVCRPSHYFFAIAENPAPPIPQLGRDIEWEIPGYYGVSRAIITDDIEIGVLHWTGSVVTSPVYSVAELR